MPLAAPPIHLHNKPRRTPIVILVPKCDGQNVGGAHSFFSLCTRLASTAEFEFPAFLVRAFVFFSSLRGSRINIATKKAMKCLLLLGFLWMKYLLWIKRQWGTKGVENPSLFTGFSSSWVDLAACGATMTKLIFEFFSFFFPAFAHCRLPQNEIQPKSVRPYFFPA